MTALSFPAVLLLALAALTGAALLARFAPGGGAQTAGIAAGSRQATLLVLSLVTASAWAGPFAVIAAFAALSGWALHGLLTLDTPRSSSDRAPRIACYACVPLQYGLVAHGPSDSLFVCLPLVAALGLPLATVLAGDMHALGERLALRFFAVMLAVYAVSYAPALLWLHAGPDAALGGAAVAFVAGIALGGSAAFDVLRVAMCRRFVRLAPRVAAVLSLLVVSVAAAFGGAACAAFTRSAPEMAAAVAACAAACGALGTLVLTAMGRNQPNVRGCVPGRLEAVAFAAPLAFFLLRALGS
jgi:phosphatidate cytidylyltransferase